MHNREGSGGDTFAITGDRIQGYAPAAPYRTYYTMNGLPCQLFVTENQSYDGFSIYWFTSRATFQPAPQHGRQEGAIGPRRRRGRNARRRGG